MGRSGPAAKSRAILGARNAPSTPPASILAIRPGGVGDTLFAFPALRRLREAFPGARIVAAGRADVLGLAVATGIADEARSIERIGLHALLVEEGPLDPAAASFFVAFDLVVSFGFDDAVVARRLGESGARAVLVTPFLPPRRARLSASSFLLRSLARLGLSGGDPVPRVRVPVEAPTAARSGRRVLALHPGSGGARKNWPAERFAAVARRFVDRTRVSVLLLSGYADEAARAGFLQAFGAEPAGRLVEACERPIDEVAGLLASSSAYLGNDSGITHLAAAVGVPVVALFRPGSDRRFEPGGRHVRVLRARTLASIGVDRVASAVGRALAVERRQ